MACPKCGCKLHYQYDGGAGWCDYLGDGEIQTDLQRCAACGEVFDIEDSTDDDGAAEEKLFNTTDEPRPAAHHQGSSDD